MVTEPSFLLTVSRVVEETAEAKSIVFEVPPELAATFDYRPGQFLTIGVPSEQTGFAARCYSICTAPGEPLTVTVKRTLDGYASNWLNDNVRAGDQLRVLAPSGIFTPADWSADLLLFAGGSGITPVLSIIRHALSQGSGRITLFYANRDEASVIFAAQLTELAAAHPDRLQVVHWLESVQGLPSQDQLRAFAADHATATSLCCGPAPFMKGVNAALRALEFPRERRKQEKFISLGGNPFEDATLAGESAGASAGPAAAATSTTVTVDLDGTVQTLTGWQPDTVLLEFLESKGVAAPHSCRQGECSACAVRLLSGEVRMVKNDILDDDDLADGLRLGCQSLPVSAEVSVTYS